MAYKVCLGVGRLEDQVLERKGDLRFCRQNVVAHTFTPRTWTHGSLNSRGALST